MQGAGGGTIFADVGKMGRIGRNHARAMSIRKMQGVCNVEINGDRVEQVKG